MRSQKTIFLFVLLLFGLIGLEAQSETNWQWTTQAGGEGNEHGISIAVDNQGNQYVTGWFAGSADFGTTTLTSSGSSDIFICKLDTDGNFLWARQAGGTDTDIGYSIGVDSAGNSYVTGQFYGTANFGNTSFTSDGYGDIFICKLDTDGNFLWARQANGTSHDMGRSIAVDNEGNQYLTGSFMDSASFGATTLTSIGSSDIFVCKLDTDGNFLWVRQAGGTAGDIGYSIGVDSNSNSFVTGWFSGNASFGDITLSSSEIADNFICKLDAAGNFLWANQTGGQSSLIAVDSSGNSYMSGWFRDSISFGDITLTGIGGIDLFICKLDATGNYLWANMAGGTSYDWGEVWSDAIAVDNSGNSYITGQFSYTIAFGNTTITSSGEIDIFICKLDPDGNFIWAK
ncbi:MAG: SBBP repeat-containing protein, partial [Candidatus Cloacimonadaceae bacterium]|nr:SBBP repeat-containing protein [Candidatus Cloacimonadaceae bacterium]